jgi:hypothetical protein
MKVLPLVILLLAAFARPASAHKPSDAQLRLEARGATISGQLAVAVRDLDAAITIDRDGDGELTWRELEAAAPRIETYVAGRLAFAADGLACAVRLDRDGVAALSDGAYWRIAVAITCPRSPAVLVITYRLLFDVDAQHRGLVHLGGQTLIVKNGDPVFATVDGATSFGSFVADGIWHIWHGLDHCLFLLCLILPAVFQRPDARWHAARSLKAVAGEVLETVTAFTLAHSITLVVSAIGLVQLPSRLVETAIAFSVFVAAANNLLRLIDARWAVAFALGLLHGFGFSSVLVDLGLPSSELIGALLGFNLGVELGQAAIVAVLLPVLYLIRKTLAYQLVLWSGSAATALIAAWWSYERWFA